MSGENSLAGNNWKTFGAAGGLVILGIAHSLAPQDIYLDWPSVSLILAGVLLLFKREILTLLPFVKKLKVGGAEVELHEKLTDLADHVERLEEAPETAKPGRPIESTALELTILDLAAKDKGAAVARLGIEIEAEMVSLCKEAGVTPRRSSWRELTNTLVEKEIIGPPFAEALIEFRNVRNRVVHSGFHGPVRDNLLDQMLHNGLQLLRLLKSSAGRGSRSSASLT